jgi:alkylation response protein AidB-like acyl-CoA dehydrogenase
MSPPPEIFCVERFPGDERLMIETAEQFCREQVLPAVSRLEIQEVGLAPTLIRKAGELGLCGVDSPEELGGLGLSKTVAARILEFMSLDASFSVTYGITTGISQVCLSLFGNQDQKQRYLPHLTSGEWIGAYALSEPDSGSDALSLSARAERRGNGYALSGTKMWISNARWAQVFVVMAKVDGERISAFLVERGFPGVSISREEHKLGLKGSSTARMVLDNVEVPEENLLGEEGKGHHVALNALNLGRFKLSAMSIGPARMAIGQAARYAQERRQFGRLVSEFGLIQKKFATMAALFYVAESMIYRTGALIDQAFAALGGDISGNRRAASEFAVECSACKVFSTEAEGSIIDEALQCFGGYGFTEEFPLARHYRDCRVSRIYEGTNEVNRLFIAERYFRRRKEWSASAEVSKDSFVGELAAEGLKDLPDGQIAMGAAADLITLVYAEQSARIRARQVGGICGELYRLALPVLNSRAAEAFQTLTGRSVQIPAVTRPAWEEIAALVYKQQGPCGIFEF